MEKEKAYIAKWKFGIKQWQVWFSGEDNEETEQKWSDACKALEEVGDSCTEPQEFFSKAVAHYESYGFTHIQK